MGGNAVKDLREWQRRHASAQERALRSAVKAQDRLVQLEAQRVAASGELAAALETLAETGVNREQAAALLGVTPASLPQQATRRRRASQDSGAGGSGSS